MNQLATVGLFLFVACIPFGGVVLGASAIPDSPTLVITQPWSSAETAIHASGGREILSTAPLAGRVAVFSEKALQEARTDRTIWFLLDANTLSFLCGGRL